LLQLANDNARHAFDEKRRASQDIEDRLADIQQRLRLPTPPRVIECCDISHLGGGDTVGGLVRLVDGEPARQGYRSFHVRKATEGDDYAAIYEVLSRRFRRGKEAAAADEQTAVEGVQEPEVAEHEERAKGWQMPDLFVVDGGRGQLSAAQAAARDLGLHELSIVALAKERETAAGETLTDRVYLPGQKNGIAVRPHTSLVLLARARDEAHRFSNHVREKLGASRRFRSALDGIPSIGEATRRKLLKRFGSLQRIREATDEQLLAVPGLTRRQLQALRQELPAAERRVEPAPSAGQEGHGAQAPEGAAESGLATAPENE
jgi:excinuclease ABC subunit C